jgi:hypothetical protein
MNLTFLLDENMPFALDEFLRKKMCQVNYKVIELNYWNYCS